jgi:hypothetical protein
MIKPEEMSLSAHQHIKNYMKKSSTLTETLTEDDLTAVLRLSQHLRVFGLLSAVGYINQSNNQASKVRERTVPVWASLLGQLLDDSAEFSQKDLREKMTALAKDSPQVYIATWRRALVLSQHWNFWARAYKE